MVSLQISVREHGREIKCSNCFPDPFFPAEGDALGNIACQRGLNTEGLCHDQNQLLLGRLTLVGQSNLRSIMKRAAPVVLSRHDK